MTRAVAVSLPGDRRRAMYGLAALAALMALLTFPVMAQEAAGRVPESAMARSYGGGRDCSPGYRAEGAECLALVVPGNAYTTGRRHGPGRTCRRGYEEVAGASFREIPVPAKAYLRSSGYDPRRDSSFQLAGREYVLGR